MDDVVMVSQCAIDFLDTLSQAADRDVGPTITSGSWSLPKQRLTEAYRPKTRPRSTGR